MSDDIYDDVVRTESDGERLEMMVDIYESADCVRDQDFRTNAQQSLQNTGNESVKMKSSRATTVCSVLRCFLLLTAVILLCVHIHTVNTNYTQEKKQLLTKIANLTEERIQLLTMITNLKKIQTSSTGRKKKERCIKHQTSFYFISSKTKNWTESRRFCTDRGADLIVINNREEQDLVKKMSAGSAVWIGLKDSGKRGKWKWVDGTNMTTGFRYWGAFEPSGGKGRNCAVSRSSVWRVYLCQRSFRGICEKSISNCQ